MTPAVPVFLSGPVPYADGVRLQEALVAARQADEIPDTVLVLEHRAVITLGRRGRSNFLLADPERLAKLGVDLFTASRGGDVTYHAPGQVVLYPIFKLGAAGADTHGHLWNLEETAIRTAAQFGVEAVRRAGMNGAWSGDGKIAAIGFHVKRWVTMHGMSFNVSLDLRGFDLIVGCGLVGQRVSSLQRLLGEECPSVAEAGDGLVRNLFAVCGRAPADPADFPMVGKILATISNPWNSSPPDNHSH